MVTYLLTYLAVTTCYRSWPQLIYDAIHHDYCSLAPISDTQRCYIFSYLFSPTLAFPFLRLPTPGWDSKTLRTGLVLSIRATWPSHQRRCILISRCIRIYRSASGSIVCAVLLYRRKVHKSYVGFSSRRRLMLAYLKTSGLCTINKTGNMSDLYANLRSPRECSIMLEPRYTKSFTTSKL